EDRLGATAGEEGPVRVAEGDAALGGLGACRASPATGRDQGLRHEYSSLADEWSRGRGGVSRSVDGRAVVSDVEVGSESASDLSSDAGLDRGAPDDRVRCPGGIPCS